MARPFSDEDKRKTIVTPAGHRIGRVRDVDEERATVDRTDDHDSLTDEIKDLLGWGDDDESYELRREHVDRYGDDELYLRENR